ncbi:MAG: hypothetical protein BGO39_25115 [Chloroflexi bacterium 54-19]|nr:MAG: hypothetical protein BGO39_25115 [Chloroflexi bacterium 54-19]
MALKGIIAPTTRATDSMVNFHPATCFQGLYPDFQAVPGTFVAMKGWRARGLAKEIKMGTVIVEPHITPAPTFTFQAPTILFQNVFVKGKDVFQAVRCFKRSDPRRGMVGEGVFFKGV